MFTELETEIVNLGIRVNLYLIKGDLRLNAPIVNRIDHIVPDNIISKEAGLAS